MSLIRTFVFAGVFAGLGSLGLLAQDPCLTVTQEEANGVLGGKATMMSLGRLGCSFSVRDKGVRLTIAWLDAAGNTDKTYDMMKQKAKSSGWLMNEEFGIGNKAYSELIRRGSQGAVAGKCGFVIVKGGKLVEVYVSDTGSSELAARKETLEKLRPVARAIAGRT